MREPELRFLAVQVGDLVAVRQPLTSAGDDWIGEVIHAEGGARSAANSLFQIACVDSGVIRTVNADAVIDILARSAALEATHDHHHQCQGTGQGNQQGDGHGGTSGAR